MPGCKLPPPTSYATFTHLYRHDMLFNNVCYPMQMVLPKAQIEDNADATIVRAQMHLQELQVVDVDRICKQVSQLPACLSELCMLMLSLVL